MPQVLFGRRRTRRLDRITWAASALTTLDLIKSYRLEVPLLRLRFRFAFVVTATAGGAVSGLNTEAGVQLLFNRLTITGFHKFLGNVIFLDFANTSLAKFWHVQNDIIGKEQYFVDPTPAVSSTGNGAREYTIVFDSPYMGQGLKLASYVDPRDFSALQVQFTTGAVADYATTNLASITSATIDIEIDELLDALDIDKPHFVPTYKEQQNIIGAVTSTDIPHLGIISGGFIPLMALTAHQNAGAGATVINSMGLVKRVSAFLGDQMLLDKAVFSDLYLNTEHDFPKAFTTTRRGGPITILWDRDRNMGAMLDNRSRPIVLISDTSSAVQADITSLTASAGDRLDAHLLVLRPNAPMLAFLKAKGIAA